MRVSGPGPCPPWAAAAARASSPTASGPGGVPGVVALGVAGGFSCGVPGAVPVGEALPVDAAGEAGAVLGGVVPVFLAGVEALPVVVVARAGGRLRHGSPFVLWAAGAPLAGSLGAAPDARPSPWAATP